MQELARFTYESAVKMWWWNTEEMGLVVLSRVSALIEDGGGGRKEGEQFSSMVKIWGEKKNLNSSYS